MDHYLEAVRQAYYTITSHAQPIKRKTLSLRGMRFSFTPVKGVKLLARSPFYVVGTQAADGVEVVLCAEIINNGPPVNFNLFWVLGNGRCELREERATSFNYILHQLYPVDSELKSLVRECINS